MVQVNLAVGGNFAAFKEASEIDPADFPFKLEVDYIRVWAGPGY